MDFLGENMITYAETIGLILCKIIQSLCHSQQNPRLFIPPCPHTKKKREKRRRSFQIMHFVFVFVHHPQGIHLVIANITLS